MILTITMNPSVDISYPLDTLKIDDVNRVEGTIKTAGGKGLNVSRVLSLMGKDLISSGIIGGHLGNFIKDQLDEDEIKHDFYDINQESRNSIAILHDNGKQTEILEAGPVISEKEAKEFMDYYKELLNKVSTITISGSLPKGLPATFYARMVDEAVQKDIKVLLDTSGESLKTSLESEFKPTLIKPNETEISELLKQEINVKDIEGLKAALKEPIFDKVEWIVVSMGAAGAFAKHFNDFYQITIPKIHVENPVGSGDSTLAGLAMAIDEAKSDEEVLKTAMTTGMLNTMEQKTGFVNPDLFDEYYAKVTVNKVK